MNEQIEMAQHSEFCQTEECLLIPPRRGQVSISLTSLSIKSKGKNLAFSTIYLISIKS